MLDMGVWNFDPHRDALDLDIAEEHCHDGSHHSHGDGDDHVEGKGGGGGTKPE